MKGDESKWTSLWMGATIIHGRALPPSLLPKRETQMQRERRCFQIKCISESQVAGTNAFFGEFHTRKAPPIDPHRQEYLLSNRTDQDKTRLAFLFTLPWGLVCLLSNT